MNSVLASLMITAVLSILPQPTYQARDFVEPQLIRTTVYTSYSDNSKTADGSVPREGMCAARKEDIGKTAILYRVDDDGSIGGMIGVFEITDCGGHEGLKNGTRVDVFRDTKERCQEWVSDIGDYTYIQIIDAQG